MLKEKLVKEAEKNVILKKDDLHTPTLSEKKAFIQLLTDIAKRLSQEKQDDSQSP